ncbi:MAG: AsmA-like C-terminal region-containing protein [Bacteroidota bacterium]
MKRVFKVTFRTIGIAFVFILTGWMGIAVYVNFHKEELLASITDQLNEDINGSLTVESMEPSLVKGFPAISVSLSKVLLRDSLFLKHGHNLLKAEKVHITLNAFSILRSTPRIRDIHIEDGTIYLFTDALGYSNTNIFVTKAVRDSSGKKSQPKLNHFFFDNIHFVYEDKKNKKKFDVEVKQMEGRFDYVDNGWRAFVDMNMLVRGMDFYNPNGPFLKSKHVSGILHAQYNSSKKILSVPSRKLDIEGNDISVGAKIFLAYQPIIFKLEFSASNIPYQEARTLLSTHIQEKLALVDVKKPLNVQVSVSGKDQKRNEPVVYARWQVKNNILEGHGNKITHCSFTGYFLNRVHAHLAVNDLNSVIALNDFSGTWSDIEFSADSLRVRNLISPVLSGRFRSSFNLEKLNPIISNNSFHLGKGLVSLNLKFKGGIRNNDTTQPFIIGDAILKDAEITYLPRQLLFKNTQAELNFRGSDLYMRNIKVQHGSNALSMDGSVQNLLNFFYTAPEKILLDWYVRSTQIDLNEYKNFLGARSKTTVVSAPASNRPSNSIGRLSAQLDAVLEQSGVQLRMNVKAIKYQKFSANDIEALVRLNQNGIDIQNASLQHAGGSVSMSGHLFQKGQINDFTMDASVEHVRVNDFFAAFGNFGQSTVTHQNIKGDFFLKANLSGAIRDNGQMIPHSINGIAFYELKNSALVEFAPIKNVGRYVFPRRNFSTIGIANLKGKLDIKGEIIRIYPVKISSDVINADVEGVYSFGKGTNINVDIPLRNPKNDKVILDEEAKAEKRNRGIVVHLNVADGADDKMNIRLVGKAIPQEGNQNNEGKRKRKNLLGL